MTVVARRNMICEFVCGVFVHCMRTCTCDPLCACAFVWHLSMFSQLKPGTCSFIRSSLALMFFLNRDFLLEIEVSLLCIQRENAIFKFFSTWPLFTPCYENVLFPSKPLKTRHHSHLRHWGRIQRTVPLTTSTCFCPISPDSQTGNLPDVLMSPLLLRRTILPQHSRWAVCLCVLHAPFIMLRWRSAFHFFKTYQPVGVRSGPELPAASTQGRSQWFSRGREKSRYQI